MSATVLTPYDPVYFENNIIIKSIGNIGYKPSGQSEYRDCFVCK